MSPRLIIALDFETQTEAFALVDQLDPALCTLKIGSELFTRLGPDFVRALVNRQFKVFLDLKFHDIPNTVARACKGAAELGVWMLNVHASGGLPMMEAAREALVSFGASRPLLIAVTVLTSMSSDDLAASGLLVPLEQRVAFLAELACSAGLDGVVCSALEVPSIKALCGQGFLTVTPGIRLADDKHDDQSRVITPERAIKAGSDYLVVGRPITRSDNPSAVVRNFLSMMSIG